MDRPDFFELKNGEKAKLPFTDKEYKNRVLNLRKIMSENNMDMAILTSMPVSYTHLTLPTILLV